MQIADRLTAARAAQIRPGYATTSRDVAMPRTGERPQPRPRRDSSSQPGAEQTAPSEPTVEAGSREGPSAVEDFGAHLLALDLAARDETGAPDGPTFTALSPLLLALLAKVAPPLP